ncbi:MAG: cytochrome c [Acidobacteria bacterium]|nr:cytochrome c [Acidobacteriota bacterium]
MRAARFVSLATLAWLIAIGFAVVPSAQAPASDEEFDKLMKSVGATVGAMRKNMEGQAAEALAADAKKMVEIQKNNAAFWTARKTQDAADWATAAMNHAAEVEKAASANNMAGAAEHMKLMMGTCGQCHTKYRDKGADGSYIIKKQ